MDKVSESIREILMPFLEKNNFELYDISLVSEYGYKVIRILIDKENGITVDELAVVNDFLSPKLDELEISLDNYMLEVSSPGAEKPLRNDEEIIKSIGEYIYIKTKENTYEGYLIAFENKKLTLKINLKGRIKEVIVEQDDIKKIRLAIKF